MSEPTYHQVARSLDKLAAGEVVNAQFFQIPPEQLGAYIAAIHRVADDRNISIELTEREALGGTAGIIVTLADDTHASTSDP